MKYVFKWIQTKLLSFSWSTSAPKIEQIKSTLNILLLCREIGVVKLENTECKLKFLINSKTCVSQDLAAKK